LDLKYRPAALIILDGWGITEDEGASARAKAKTPFYDGIEASNPGTALSASGVDVGLPEGQMGNSEVGHLNIGAGRIVYQDYTRINMAVEDGSFFENETLVDAMESARESGGRLHMMGLMSDGGVHSDQKHLYALLGMARRLGVKDVRIHAFLDGRDTPPKSGAGYLRNLVDYVNAEGLSDMARIATVSGRYYAMDRDNRWERVRKAYDAIVSGAGNVSDDGVTAIEEAYERGETDEFVVPTVINYPTDPKPENSRLADGDSVIFFNFRTDRARELTRALALDDFGGFERADRPRLSYFACMTEYDETFGLPVAFPPKRLENILGGYLSSLGLRQLRIAETEKYAHVTFFFNGGEEEPFEGEDRCLIPSPKDVPTYDKKPQMSAYEVTDEVLKRIASGVYDVIVMNYANPDMVGHTGIMEAAVKACEALDECLSKVVPAVLETGGIVMITSDHGNVERMRDDSTGQPYTAHTSNLVPLIVVGEDIELDGDGILADVAPTLLDLVGLKQPGEMTGRSLIRRS